MTLISSQNELREAHGRWAAGGAQQKTAAVKTTSKKSAALPSNTGKAPPGIPPATWKAALAIISKEMAVKSATGKPTPQQIMYARVLAKAREIIRAQAAAAKKSATQAKQSATAGTRAASQASARQRATLRPVQGKLNTRGVRAQSGQSRAQLIGILQRQAAQAAARP
jgi:adenine-specific DNA methylase